MSFILSLLSLTVIIFLLKSRIKNQSFKYVLFFIFLILWVYVLSQQLSAIKILKEKPAGLRSARESL